MFNYDALLYKITMLIFRYKKSVTFFAAIILLLIKFVGFIIVPPSFYVLFLVACLFFLFFKPQKISIGSLTLLLFLLVTMLSIIFNNSPKVFRSWSRFLFLILLITSISPLFQNRHLCLVRLSLLNSLGWCLVFISVGSFLCYPFGVNYMNYTEGFVAQTGTFAGLSSHSMILGPVAGFSILFLVYLSFKKTYMSGYKKCFYVLMLICSCGALLLAASRSSLLACIAGVVCFFYILFKEKKHLFLKKATLIVVLLLVTFPLWESYTTFLVKKQVANNESFDTLAGSRERKWEARFMEFTDSPIIGIGFSTIDPKYDFVNKETGTIEPGSSWLALLSMTGFVGFLFFFAFFLQTLKISVKKITDKKTSAFFTASLVALFIHLFFEGYLLAAGSGLSFLAWLILGCVHSLAYLERNRII